jgi:pimeloyl-ACP methyl ester carboxylesterase
MPSATARDGTHLYYEVTGAGESLMLVAGQAQGRGAWHGVRDDFAARHRVIVFDHRGTGDSDKPEQPAYSTRGFADDAVAILDDLGIARAHVYGISMGGRVAQCMAAYHAARVGALVLGCTTPGNAHAVRRPAEVDPVLASGNPAHLMPFLVSPAWMQANRAFLAELDAMTRSRPVPTYARALHYRANEGHDVWDLLPGITAPTLVVHGSDDQMNVPANAEVLAKRIPGAELRIIDGARHAYYYEFRAEASQLVLDFLARHPLEG